MCRCALQIVISELTRTLQPYGKMLEREHTGQGFFGSDVTAKLWPAGLNITEGQLSGSRRNGRPALQRQLEAGEERQPPPKAAGILSSATWSAVTLFPPRKPEQRYVCGMAACFKVEDTWVPSCSLTSKQMTAPWAGLCWASVNVCVCLPVHALFVSGLWLFIACSHLRLGNHTEKTGEPFSQKNHSSLLCIESDEPSMKKQRTICSPAINDTMHLCSIVWYKHMHTVCYSGAVRRLFVRGCFCFWSRFQADPIRALGTV